MQLLKGKIAVITGAASARGLGKATAQMMSDHGAKIAILDLDQSAAAFSRSGSLQQSLLFFRLLVCISALVFCAVFTRRLRRRTCSTRFCCTAKPAFGWRPEPRRVRTSSRL